MKNEKLCEEFRQTKLEKIIKESQEKSHTDGNKNDDYRENNRLPSCRPSHVFEFAFRFSNIIYDFHKSIDTNILMVLIILMTTNNTKISLKKPPDGAVFVIFNTTS